MGYVVCMTGKGYAYRVLVGKPKEGDHLEDLGIDILHRVGGYRVDASASGQG